MSGTLPRGDRRGFSLVELLQVLVIFSIVMAMVFGLFIQVKRMIERREAYHRLLERTRGALRLVEGAVGNARGWCGGDTLGITILDREDEFKTIRWDPRDSQLTVGDGGPAAGNGRVVRFAIRYRPRSDSAALLPEDELFEALDGDGSGALEGGELARARTAEIVLRLSDRGRAAEMSAVVRLPRPVADTTVPRW